MRRAFTSLFITTVSCLAGVTATAGPPTSTNVQVMTQNQYVGANLFPLIPALASGEADVINSALVGIISTISANRTVDRVNPLSGEILERKPDFVGIQEAWLIWCEPAEAAPCTNPEFRGAWGDHLAQTEYLLSGAYTKATYIDNFEFGYPFWDGQDGRAERVEDILREADVVSIHTVLDDSTRHLINAERLALMKDNALVVNTSRGPVIDEAALVAHCRTHPNFRAGLACSKRSPSWRRGWPSSRMWSLFPTSPRPPSGRGRAWPLWRPAMWRATS